MRIGIGYDIHRLARGRNLVIGGVRIPHSSGLAGHSDADVLVHAVMDALLGAAALRDIGFHFPPGDPAYKDISSLMLLKQVGSKIAEAGYKIGNIDSVVIAEEPKLSGFIDEMRRNIAGALGISDGQVMVKATTNEGLDAAGGKKGIAAYATALLE
ncbi:MAG: 2-C-methyl-D-erythritol 2,4-cyclodiphosphate synthase [Chloroflexi bacterium RBG_16_48_7]|nr:MAG: 2-C-methyl-D-erythritol 2,4-cyclodiphosphate synthase [Chloroflexi bacterium RBG_16_48_7]